MSYTEMEYNKDFIKLLQKYRETKEIISMDSDERSIVKDPVYYNTLAFRTMICEMIYQAIQMFPIIKEYTIHCQNDKGKSKITIGFLEEMDNDGEPGIIKVENKHGCFILDKTDVHNLYIFNRCIEGDVEIINALLLCLFLDGYQPSVRVEIKSFSGNKGKEKF